MNEKHTPLEEFEFRQAAKIRTPEEKRERPTPQKRSVLLTVLLLIMLAGALSAGGFLYHLLQLQQKKTAQLAKDLASSRKEKTETAARLEEIQQKLKKMTRRISTSSKGKGELLSSIDQLKQNIDKRDQEIRSQKQKIRKKETAIKQSEKARKATEAKLAREKTTSQKLKTQLDAAKITTRGFQDEVEKLHRTIQTLQSNMNQEGNASRKLVSDMLNAQNEAATLRKEKNTLENSLNSLKNEIKLLKQVAPGKLVPFSDLVTPAKPIVHPTATIDKKRSSGKVRGFILVNAYIDETGFVQNAFYLESHLQKGEKNGAIISEALKTVLKWRFSPAMYNETIPVKIWQPVVIPINNK
ncbi:MAG: hypothetical protein GXO70_05775 [Acidobacteria bacterium]|nr:hypothetical protein [Acidobacteriota bacterium]